MPLLVSAMILGEVPSAMSAVAYRIWTEPATPLVGEPTPIYVATYWPDSSGLSDAPEPMAIAQFPWDFVADSPRGVRHLVELAPVADFGNQWVGRFTFDEVGEWVVGLDPRHLGTPVDPTLGARATVMVGEEGDDGDVGGSGMNPVLIVALSSAGVLATLLALLLRRQRHSP